MADVRRGVCEQRYEPESVPLEELVRLAMKFFPKKGSDYMKRHK